MYYRHCRLPLHLTLGIVHDIIIVSSASAHNMTSGYPSPRSYIPITYVYIIFVSEQNIEVSSTHKVYNAAVLSFVFTRIKVIF